MLMVFTLQCVCTIKLNKVTIILIHQEVYDSLKEMKQIIMLMLIQIILRHLNNNQTLLEM